MSTEPGDGKPLLDRPANPLCTRCGLCCVMLSVQVSSENREIIAEENNIPQKKFCHTEPTGTGPNPGEEVLTMPCRFLLGRPMDYVSCRIYGKTRPDVCPTYLCRIAIQYKLGIVELNEGLRLLDKAYRTGQVSIFNWWDREGDKELQQSMLMAPLREEATEMVENYGVDGLLGELDEEEVGDILIAKSLTPAYLVHSDFAHLELNLLLAFFDRGDHELKDVIPESLIRSWTSKERQVAMVVYTGLLWKLRSLFKTREEIEADQADKEFDEGVERPEPPTQQN